MAISCFSKCYLCTHLQYGFIKEKSTDLALKEFISEIALVLEGRENLAAIFMGLSKAFDCLDHNYLKTKLEKIGSRGSAPKWVIYYLSGKTQVVKHDRKIYDEEAMNFDGLQGSILSQTLFKIFINDILNCINNDNGTIMM